MRNTEPTARIDMRKNNMLVKLQKGPVGGCVKDSCNAHLAWRRLRIAIDSSGAYESVLSSEHVPDHEVHVQRERIHTCMPLLSRSVSFLICVAHDLLVDELTVSRKDRERVCSLVVIGPHHSLAAHKALHHTHSLVGRRAGDFRLPAR